MTKIHIDSIVAEEILRAAVAEKGEEYVYHNPEEPGQCRYVVYGQPSCIVGDGLNRLGVSPGRLSGFDFGDGVGVGSVLADLQDEGILTYTGKARIILSVAQSWQDDSSPWGHALSEALRAAEQYREDGSIIDE